MLANNLVDIREFTVIKVIGNGGFGEVYLVKNTITHEQMAAKACLGGQTFDFSQQKVFLSELETLVKVSHPACVLLKGLSLTDFQNNNIPILFLEYYPNGSLDAILRDEKQSRAPPEWNITTKYINLVGIALGMENLHSYSIVHRDLKPGNVLLDQNYHPKICDFGLSKNFDLDLSSVDVSPLSTTSGTILYMAPEMHNGEFSRKVDVFSYSYIFYEIISGCSPQIPGCKTIFKIIEKVMEGQRPDLGKIPNKEAQLFLTKCWAQSPQDRPDFHQIIQFLLQESFFSLYGVDRSILEAYLSECGNQYHIIDSRVIKPVEAFERHVSQSSENSQTEESTDMSNEKNTTNSPNPNIAIKSTIN